MSSQEHTVRLPVGGKGMPHVSFTIPTSLSICSFLPDGKETPEAKEKPRREEEEKKKKKERTLYAPCFVCSFVYLFIYSPTGLFGQSASFPPLSPVEGIIIDSVLAQTRWRLADLIEAGVLCVQRPQPVPFQPDVVRVALTQSLLVLLVPRA